ncbi:LysR family transcriptional regulator [Bosea caraganae]|nr:LysR family transcriptional regulator [Bosea caraganae]
MRPTTAQLETFFWVVRLGSVKEAARHLNLAQPTISLRLQELEAQFQRPLFDRVARRLTLTPAGDALLPRASSLIHELSGIRELIGGALFAAGVVRVGLSETFAQICLSDCMKLLARDFPALQLDITVGTSAALEHQVVERQLDLAFVVNPVGDPKLAVIQLGIQDAVWAAAPSLGLPREITPARLASAPIVTNPHPSPMYRQIIDWFREDGIEPGQICRCTSVALVVELVRAGLGVSLLPARLIEPFLNDGSLVALQPEKEPTPSRLYCIYRFAEHSPLVEAVLGAARQAITDLRFVKA